MRIAPLLPIARMRSECVHAAVTHIAISVSTQSRSNHICLSSCRSLTCPCFDDSYRSLAASTIGWLIIAKYEVSNENGIGMIISSTISVSWRMETEKGHSKIRVSPFLNRMKPNHLTPQQGMWGFRMLAAVCLRSHTPSSTSCTLCKIGTRCFLRTEPRMP